MMTSSRLTACSSSFMRSFAVVFCLLATVAGKSAEAQEPGGVQKPQPTAATQAVVTTTRPTTASAPASQPQSLAARSRLGMNLAGPADWDTEYPFVDVARYARPWISQKKGAKWGEGPKLELDEHGWVKRLEPDCWAESPICTSGHNPPGEYVCLYEGEGEIEFWNHKKTVSTEPGRIVFELDGTKGFFLRLKKTNPDNPLRNIRVIMPGYENSYQAHPFHPAFLERWKDFNAFRFMDWMCTNGSKISKWSDRPTPQSATYCEKGVPLEVMIDLCNRQKINPWFCMPHLADDDYVRNFAKMVKDRLDPSLKVYVEYSNEVWNSTFQQTRYAQQKGQELGLGAKERPWEGGAMYHAQRSVEIFKIWEEVFGGKDRLVRVLAWQAASGLDWTDGKLLAQKDTAKNVDALAIAPYITMCVPEKNKNPDFTAAAVAGRTVDQVLDYAEQKALPESLGWIERQKKVADKYGIKLVAYESGQHLVGVGGGENNDALTKLFHAANRHPRMGEIYAKYLTGWKSAGGDLMCIFSSVGKYSKWGSWGLLEYCDQPSSEAPKYKAVIEWNRQNLRD